jgi:hypothetical protein
LFIESGIFHEAERFYLNKSVKFHLLDNWAEAWREQANDVKLMICPA